MPNQANPLNSVRFVYRFIYLSLLILGGILLASLLRVFFGPHWMRRMPGRGIVRLWMRLSANSLGLKIQYQGPLIARPVMIVANHISWLDILVIGTLFPTAFVSKDEVRRWPLIGRLAALTGTQFLKRHSVSSLRRSIERVQGVLEQGQSVTVFPEGTTSDGRSVLPFHAGLFKAAIAAGVPVQPLVLFYHRQGERDTYAPFIGETTFLEHIVSMMWLPETQVVVIAGDPVLPLTSSIEMASQCHVSITQLYRPLLKTAFSPLAIA